MDPLKNLELRVAFLGNHFQKFLHTIRQFHPSLSKSLDNAEKLTQIHLWQSSFSPAEEMHLITSLPEDPQTRLHNLSCYYALQYIHMIFRNLDILELGTTAGITSTEVYHKFMMQIGHDFRTLSIAYITNLINIYLCHKEVPEFFICSVGTRADQDDIDFGIITSDDGDATELNKALQKITQNMLVYATPLHLYLSEHVGEQVYTTTISEYINLLDRQIQDVVIISELLNAKIIYGSEKLFSIFKDRVIDRYFYMPGTNIRFHEGFLRGILGEARSMLISPPGHDAICPKDDALRMLKLLLYAKKTICSVKEVNAWEIITALEKCEPHLKSDYELLFKAVSFLEIFKFLLQLYVNQEETFSPQDIDSGQLATIAERMGYQAIGTVSAWDQLIIDYYRYVKEVRKLGDFLLSDINTHLGKISIFVGMFKNFQVPKRPTIAESFIVSARFYHGTKYWEDVLNLLESDEKLLEAFIVGFNKMSARKRTIIINEYVSWAEFSFITIIRLITIVGNKQRNDVGETVYHWMCTAFFPFIETLPYATDRLCRIFSHYPDFIHEFLQLLPEEYYIYLERILSRQVINEKVLIYQKQLIELCNIHKWSGQYFHRFFDRVIRRYPEYLSAVTDTAQLAKIASGLLAMVDVYPSPMQKKEILGNYYDLEFLRVGIGTMRGTDLQTTNRDFTEFCDNYITGLFQICNEEVSVESHGHLPNTDHLVILAAGGHGRSQAYDDDYDIIVMTKNEDEKLLQYATRIVTRMNREILKRGLLPHYRLGEILGGFVNPLPQIVGYLKDNPEEGFIDLSQILGGRVIIGGLEMREVIRAEIIQEFIFSQRKHYIERMIREIYNRQKVDESCNNGHCSLKEARGGLRDIEAIALMLKAYLASEVSLSELFFDQILHKVPAIKRDLLTLGESIRFLRTVRNLYRLMVSAEDRVEPAYLSALTPVFQKGDQNRRLDSGDAILDHIRHALKKSAKACDRVIDYLNMAKNL